MTVTVVTGFRREIDENSALLGCYLARNGNFLPTFRDDISVPSSGVKIQKLCRDQESKKTFGLINQKSAGFKDVVFSSIFIFISRTF